MSIPWVQALCMPVARLVRAGATVLVVFPPGSFLDLAAHRLAEARIFAALVADLHAQDRAAFGIGRQLHVHRRVEAAVGHLHHPRLSIGGADPRLPLPDLRAALAMARSARRFGLFLLQLRQLCDGLLQPLLLVRRRTLAP